MPGPGPWARPWAVLVAVALAGIVAVMVAVMVVQRLPLDSEVAGSILVVINPFDENLPISLISS